MGKVRTLIRTSSVVLLLMYFAFIFSTSKSTGIGKSTAKLISYDGNTLVMEMPFTEREIEVSNTDEFLLVEGQWYQVSHKRVTWGYYPLLIEVESTYKIESYYDFENEVETDSIQTSLTIATDSDLRTIKINNDIIQVSRNSRDFSSDDIDCHDLPHNVTSDGSFVPTGALCFYLGEGYELTINGNEISSLELFYHLDEKMYLVDFIGLPYTYIIFG